MDIEENDEVEKEIDIIYSSQFSNETKLFQFPLIPKNSINIQNINSLNISKDRNSMKMEMKIDQKYLDKNNYNAVPIQNLKGEKAENNTNLCLGMLINNKLFLSPISHIYQFRHDFSNINQDNNLDINLKKGKKELNLGLKKNEQTETKYTPLTIHQPESIDNNVLFEKIALSEGDSKKANLMSKNEYFDLLLKYVITPDTGGDTNDDYLHIYKNNFSKESIMESNNENKIKDDEDDYMMVEKENEKENKKNKKKGFNSGIETLKNEKKSSKGEIENGNSIVYNIISNLFEDNECLYYDSLLNGICQKMNIAKNDNDSLNQIKKEIEEKCILIKDNSLCYMKIIDDSDLNKVRNLIIEEIGNNENGLKKQQIKKLIEKNGLSISDSKLNKLLQKLCKYSGSSWVIKPPSED